MKTSSKVLASYYLFPVAALYGAIVLPWSVLAMLGHLWAPPGLLSRHGHIHELLAGYAIVVVLGYLLGKVSWRLLGSVLFVWIAGRLTFLMAPFSGLAVGTALLLGLCFAWLTVPRFARSAKKWRNRSLVPLLLLLSLSVVAVALPVAWGREAIWVLLMGLCLLMFFMGGRTLAPAVAGHLIRQKIPMPARVQPNIEGAGIILLFLAMGAGWWAPSLAGACLAVVGVLVLVRMWRWQLWHCKRRWDLLWLASGYAWLGVGLLLLGLSFLGHCAWRTAGAHAITVGALGTLTVTIMARTRMIQRFRDPNALISGHVASALMNGAALLRVGQGLLGGVAGLYGAAALWSAAMVALGWTCWRSRMA